MAYKTIRFHGVLREKFGKEWRLEVSSVKEAMRLLAVQIQGLEHFMLNAHKKGLRFAVFIGNKRTISEKEVDMSTGSELIRIIPIVEGAGGNGVLQTVLGAVMVVVGVVITGLSYGWAAPVGQALIGAGMGMMVGGVAQMLMPKTQTDDANSDGNKSNYGFGSAVTTVAQGNPVPILYGEFEIGGFVLNGGQYPEDQL
ncbi:tail assembly protein [Acinetobacter sp. S40]|uniref:tail assembly protein n=1 Tax=Acinetobacter sp. S40 TaxID=2767434 RepID=UPI00190A3783|nr:tail assembly protein [Acinetobacter sp. S40]MBJ9984422.1 tail assembly protein [Acinetobacter sp. S40]